MYSLSTILISRFHIHLQTRNAYTNTNTSRGLPTISIGSFHAATQRIHDAVLAEFGNPGPDLLVGSVVSSETVMPTDRDMSAEMTEDDISLVEIQSSIQDAENTLEV
jgi:hypothetical protein